MTDETTRMSLPEALAALAVILPKLDATLGRLSKNASRVEPMAYRIDEFADAIRVSRRVFERERSAGRIPPPDRKLGKMPLWRRETIDKWLAEGGRP